MSKLRYENWRPGADALGIIETANAICAEYAAQGYDLTLRQLYYQFVARDLLPNRQESYKRLGNIVNKGRLAGLIDWSFIVDRTRSLRGTSHWSNPSEVINSAASSYRIDKWADQPVRVEVFVEKEALAGIVQRAADTHDVDWFSCRGYVSQSELWAAGRRHLHYLNSGQRVIVLHLGDHDPSGIDMTRDIRDRLRTFVYTDWHRAHPGIIGATYGAIQEHIDSVIGLDGNEPVEVRRIALNFDQVEEYDPPPNPAKLTDSRSNAYVLEYGDDSWELDALDPAMLGELIAENIRQVRDDDLYWEQETREADDRQTLALISERYDEIAETYGTTTDDTGDTDI